MRHLVFHFYLWNFKLDKDCGILNIFQRQKASVPVSINCQWIKRKKSGDREPMESQNSPNRGLDRPGQ